MVKTGSCGCQNLLLKYGSNILNFTELIKIYIFKLD